jgi:hypothetical protein
MSSFIKFAILPSVVLCQGIQLSLQSTGQSMARGDDLIVNIERPVSDICL